MKKTKNKTASKKLPGPLGREVFFRPERSKYVRKQVQEPGCVFCKSAIAKVSFESLTLWKSKHSMIVMNKYPYNNGHLLVLPLAHCGDLLQLTEEQYTDLALTLRKAVQAVSDCIGPQGFNLGLNHGACSGAGIPEHLHYHIVPRWKGDTNFFPLIAQTKVVVETLEQTYDRLLPYFR